MRAWRGVAGALQVFLPPALNALVKDGLVRGVASPPPPLPPPPKAINALQRLVVFGDSLSDTGRLRSLYPAIPNATLYHQGRFTNGPNYVDYVQADTNASVSNYAVAGGVMCAANVEPGLNTSFPAARFGLDGQISLALADLASAGPAARAGRNVAMIW